MGDRDRRELLQPETPEGQAPEEGRRWSSSEQPVIGDGQLGAENLERGPERSNPEGTMGIGKQETEPPEE